MKLLLKILLIPFSVIYGLITFLRNKFFDWNLFRSISFSVPLICVGNLNAGGTGKSPHIEFLISLLNKNGFKNLCSLSRGYGRKTIGYFIANDTSTAAIIGDEPMQFYNKFPELKVAVCENRVVGIQELLEKFPETDCILLDDAFQHRRLKAGMNILLTDYNNLYTQDCVLPSGRLREFRSGAKRADIIIVTKSPETISENEKNQIINSLKPEPYQNVFFSYIRYKKPVSFFKNSFYKDFSILKNSEILLFTGIANPAPLEEHLKLQCEKLHTLRFGDHHIYTEKDIKNISQKFRNIASEKKVVISTEKDFVRLIHHNNLAELSELPGYYIPVEMDFSETDKQAFEQIILNYVGKN